MYLSLATAPDGILIRVATMTNSTRRRARVRFSASEDKKKQSKYVFLSQMHTRDQRVRLPDPAAKTRFSQSEYIVYGSWEGTLKVVSFQSSKPNRSGELEFYTFYLFWKNARFENWFLTQNKIHIKNLLIAAVSPSNI